MNEMLNYIFGSMRASEKTIKTINKTLKHQRRFNSGMIFAVAGTAACISAVKSRVEKLNDKIKKLEKRIDELAVPEEAIEKEFNGTKGE